MNNKPEAKDINIIELILALDELRDRLIRSGVQRTAGIYDAMGDDCTYYKKSFNVFANRDCEQLRDLIERVNMLYKKCPRLSKEPRGNSLPTGETNVRKKH